MRYLTEQITTAVSGRASAPFISSETKVSDGTLSVKIAMPCCSSYSTSTVRVPSRTSPSLPSIRFPLARIPLFSIHAKISSAISPVSPFSTQYHHHGRRKLGGGGGGGRVSRSRKISGGRPSRIDDISVPFFLDTYGNFAFSTIFKIKWSKSEKKLNFEGIGGFGCL